MQTVYLGSMGKSSTILKLELMRYLETEFNVIDVNEYIENKEDSAQEVARRLLEDKEAKGIVLCGNGFGVAKEAQMVSSDNTVINCISVSQAISGRLINNANILALGARIVTEGVAKEIVERFLRTQEVHHDR